MASATTKGRSWEQAFFLLAMLLLAVGCAQQPPTATPGPWGDLQARVTFLEQPSERQPIEEAMRVYYQTMVRMVLGEISVEEAEELVREAVAYDPELTSLWAGAVAREVLLETFQGKLFERYFTPIDSGPKAATTQR